MITKDLYDYVCEIGEIPAHTCPDIDAIISSIRNSMKAADRITCLAEPDSKIADLAREIEVELWGHEGTLELLRERNQDLRLAAKNWKKAFNDYIEIEEPEAVNEKTG